MIARLTPPQVIRRVRQRLGLSQESLARSLNATKGAVQHWEHGRNSPDLARLMALLRLCPEGREQLRLKVLIRMAERRATPLAADGPVRHLHRSENGLSHASLPPHSPQASLSLLRLENDRLQQKVLELETTLQKRDARLRILEALAEDLQRELVSLRACGLPRLGRLPGKPVRGMAGSGSGPSTSDQDSRQSRMR